MARESQQDAGAEREEVAQPEQLKIPMTWDRGDELAAIFVDQSAVQPLGHHVVITMGQSMVPVIMGPDDPTLAQLQETGIPVRIKGRFVFTRADVAAFAAKIQEQLGLGEPSNADQ